MHAQAGGGPGRVRVDSKWSRRGAGRAGRSRAAIAPLVEALEGRLLLAGNPPTAADDSFSTLVNVPLNVPAPGVLVNDADPEADALTSAVVGMPSHGTLVLNSNGSFLYTPNAPFRGVDTFTYKANDGTSDSNTATVSITVNTPPVAVNDSFMTDEDTPLSIAVPGVLGNDTDANSDPLTTVLGSTTSHGTLTLNPNGSFTYAPDHDYNGPDSFTYRANDGLSVSNLATVSITINAVNDAPVAVDDSFSTAEDTPLTIAAPGVLANDTDVEGDTLTAVVVGAPAHGMLTFNANGSFTYSPDHDYNGPDSFTYRAEDSFDQSNIATVSLTVTPVNDPPVAVDDSFATAEDTPLSIAVPGVLGNDTDVDNASLTAQLVAGVGHGNLTLNANGSFTYTPAADYSGPDSFTYLVSDGTLQSNVATVSLTVNAVNDLPVAVDDSFSTPEETQLVIAVPGVLGNDTDAENDPLSAELVAATSHGTLTLNANGSFTYTPAADYSGPDSFTYRAKDAGGSSNTATVALTVTPVNDTPVAVDDTFTTAEDTPLSVNTPPGILGNDTDADGDALSPVLGVGPAHGTLNLNVNGTFVYTPAANYSGPDSFTYRVTDGQALSNFATVSITVTPVNDPPVAADDSFTTVEDTPLSVAAPGVLGNDTDVENDPLTATVAVAPAHGQLTLNADGSFTYTPAANYSGPDSFTYRAGDGNGQSNVATVSLTVTAVNDAPVAANDTFSTPQNVPLNVPVPGVLGNDNDADGDAMTAAVVTPPTNGTLALNANGSFLYTPNPNYNGPDSFTYRASDGNSQSNLATVNITVIRPNQAPTAGDTVFATGQDVALPAGAPGVLQNATDPEGDPLTAVLVGQPAHGTLNLNANGSFVYTPAPGFHGSDFFTYRANDGRDLSNIATANIVVTPPNSAPVAHEDTYNAATSTTLSVAAPGVLANDTDADGNTLFALLVTGPAHGTLDLNTNGSFVYTPVAGFNGTDTFSYRASDVSAQSIPVLVTIRVGPVAAVLTAFGLSDNDTGARDGFTMNNTPGFTGLAPAGDLVQLQARRRGTDTFFPVGQVLAAPNGQYAIRSTPLLDGNYQFRVTATRPGASSPEAVKTLGSLVIDRTPPKIAGVLLSPRQGRFIVTFTEAQNTLNLATALDRFNYQFARVLANGALRNLTITSVTVQSPSQVLVTVNNGQRLTSGRFFVTVGSGGVFDLAGNSLDGEFNRTLPSGNGIAGGNFRARFTYNGVRVVGPLVAPAAIRSTSVPAGPLRKRG